MCLGVFGDSLDQATDSDISSDERLEELIVYGTKQYLSLQEVDVSIEVFDSERIEQESLFDLDDLLLRTPNVQSSGSTASLSIRGISRIGNGGVGSGATSNVFLDETPISTIALAIGLDSLWDIEQVEVLRGPQSTVRGRNTLAGAVVIRTTEPTFDWQGKLRARVAEFNTQQYAGAFSGPLIDEELAFRLVFDQQRTDGFIRDAVTGQDHNSRDNTLLRGKLLAMPRALPTLRAQLLLDYNDGEAGQASNLVSANTAANDPAFLTDFSFNDGRSYRPIERSDNETLRTVFDLNFDLSGVASLRGVLTYENNRLQQQTGTEQSFAVAGLLANQLELRTNETDTASLELGFRLREEQWSASLGVYLFREEGETDSMSVSPLIGSVPFVPIPTTTRLISTFAESEQTDNFAVYVEGSYRLDERWTLDWSARYDQEDVLITPEMSTTQIDPSDCLADLSEESFSPESAVILVPCADFLESTDDGGPPDEQEDSYSAFLPRVAINYQLNDAVNLFASVQRGYRAGGSYLRFTGERFVVESFDPEYLSNLELGFRSQWLDDRLTVNGNVFFARHEDQQVLVPGPSGGFFDGIVLNAGESENFGAELSLDFVPNSSLSFYGSFGWLNATFEDFPFAAPGTPYSNLAGNRLANSPKLSFTIGASYQHQSGVFADASWNYVGSLFTDNTNLTERDLGPGLSEHLGNRNLVNARLGYEGRGFLLQAYVTNLLDEDQFTNLDLAQVELGGGTTEFREDPTASLIRPRVFGFLVEWTFL
ncbi:MAG: TonB-dependent receptor [Pseudomonadota bacterium]